jgi:hypothetical protein
VDVNRQGYLFVDDLDLNAINVYAPKADRRDPPLHTISIWEIEDSIRNMRLDAAGRLYVLTYSPPVFVFDDPVRQWSMANGFLVPEGGYEFSFNTALALDDRRGEIYVNFGPQNLSDPWGKDDFAMRRLDASPVIRADRWIRTRDCRGGSGEQGTNPGAVISGDYLLFSCANDFNAVLAYRARDFRKQELVEAVGFGMFQAVTDIAIGP